MGKCSILRPTRRIAELPGRARPLLTSFRRLRRPDDVAITVHTVGHAAVSAERSQQSHRIAARGRRRGAAVVTSITSAFSFGWGGKGRTATDHQDCQQGGGQGFEKSSSIYLHGLCSATPRVFGKSAGGARGSPLSTHEKSSRNSSQEMSRNFLETSLRKDPTERNAVQTHGLSVRF